MGGLMQLVAYGAQDIYMTKSYIECVIKMHFNKKLHKSDIENADDNAKNMQYLEQIFDKAEKFCNRVSNRYDLDIKFLFSNVISKLHRDLYIKVNIKYREEINHFTYHIAFKEEYSRQCYKLYACYCEIMRYLTTTLYNDVTNQSDYKQLYSMNNKFCGGNSRDILHDESFMPENFKNNIDVNTILNNIKMQKFTYYMFNINNGDNSFLPLFDNDETKILEISYSSLQRLPKLPTNLLSLNVSYNRLKDICGDLPESIINYEVQGNELVEFQHKNSVAKHINISNNNIIELPDITFMKFYAESESSLNENFELYKMDIMAEDNSIKYMPESYYPHVKSKIINLGVYDNPVYDTMVDNEYFEGDFIQRMCEYYSPRFNVEFDKSYVGL
jgi:hypothetical protein